AAAGWRRRRRCGRRGRRGGGRDDAGRHRCVRTDASRRRGEGGPFRDEPAGLRRRGQRRALHAGGRRVGPRDRQWARCVRRGRRGTGRRARDHGAALSAQGCSLICVILYKTVAYDCYWMYHMKKCIAPTRRSLRVVSALAAAAIVAACGGGGDSGATGTLSVKLTDAPACGYDNVWVTVTKVRVHRSDTASDTDPGWSELVVTPDPGRDGRRIDLLSLQNGVLADLGQTALPAGRYSQVRLVLSDAQGANQLLLTGDASRTPISLDTPSAQQSGLKLRHGFDVAADTEVDLVLDFDACKSIVKAGNSGKYNLKPVVSVIPILVGTVAGAVDPAAARAEASVSLQRFDPASGTVSVVRATSVRADGTWTLS